ncbi:hypothetical protein F5Y16DRAFT_381564 [Xylariaceae sp. FL0255]|nr:hypothetical protein F5Y16DRAFT_381564 [Xylariaceae sp. FL0255]
MSSSTDDSDDLGRPLSVKEISQRAANFEWNANIPFKAWLRTAQTLQQEANIYFNEGNLGQAYLLFLRYSTLILDHLKTHPEYAHSKEAKQALRSKALTIDIVLRNLEKIKPALEAEYNEWNALYGKGLGEKEEKASGSGDKQDPSTYQQHAAKDPALSSANRLLDASEHQDLAIELAKQEIRSRDAKKRAARQAGVTEEEEQARRSAGFWDDWTQELADRQAREEETFREQMKLTRSWVDRDADKTPGDPNFSSPAPQSEQKYEQLGGLYLPIVSPLKKDSYRQEAAKIYYPSITKSTPLEYPHSLHLESRESSGQKPPVPPKPQRPHYSSNFDSNFDIEDEAPWPMSPGRPLSPPPLLPTKRRGSETLLTPQVPQSEYPRRPPKVPEHESKRPKKQQGVSFKAAAYLENGEPIRPIFLPSDLREKFLEKAEKNTKKGLEMCGILCGTAVNNALFIRCLLIPEQKCTSDTCETENEHSMLEYCINEDLLILGWIHTHPTQSCFMSSRDLHTQAGYQVMLPESIAIVCAPKFRPSYGIFRLTKPPGLQHILDCTHPALFHGHEVDNLYTEAIHPPGHVYEHDDMQWYIHDIRPESNGAGAGTSSMKF